MYVCNVHFHLCIMQQWNFAHMNNLSIINTGMILIIVFVSFCVLYQFKFFHTFMESVIY